MFKKKLEQLVKSRKYYTKKHQKKYKGKKRGTQATEVEQTLQANHACQWRNCHRTDKKQYLLCEW